MPARAPNRLAHEPSPYLAEHAHDPVDWYPWGPEALSRAAREDRPILLSIGYSACHWCHVMQRECFQDEAIAARMNEAFVCIKVDREERPDLDQVHQTVVQLLGKGGGWPLTVFLASDGRPFFGGTYWPPVERHGLPAFPRVLDAIALAWRDRREELVEQAAELSAAIGTASAAVSGRAQASPPRSELLPRATRSLAARFDAKNGGFGARPKFPSVTCLEVLLRHGVADGDAESAARVRLALDAMARGGVRDHLAGGFHRYSTDEQWLVPHFEKMLYDNALLLRLYAEAWRAFGEPAYRDVARETARYLLAELELPDGGFAASTDADTDGVEGRFFVWTPGEIRAALGADATAVEVTLRCLGVGQRGNFEGGPASVLHAARAIDDVARELGVAVDDASDALVRGKRALLAARARRTPPRRDGKLVAAGNGLAITALAESAACLDEPTALAAARRAFARIERELVREGRVARLVADGVVKGPGFLDDHACVAEAALALHAATGEPAYLATATSIARVIVARFVDVAEAGFFLAADDAEPLVHRQHDAFDQGVPSGAAVACTVLLALGAIADESLAAPAEAYLERVAGAAVENPFAFGRTILALDRHAREPVDVAIVGAADDARTAALREAALLAWVPNANVVSFDPARPETTRVARVVAEGKPAAGAPLAYVCRDRACSLPLATPAELEAALAPLRRV